MKADIFIDFRQVGAPSQQQFDMHINGKNHKERRRPDHGVKIHRML
jgi:hypothetical protein